MANNKTIFRYYKAKGGIASKTSKNTGSTWSSTITMITLAITASPKQNKKLFLDNRLGKDNKCE